MTSWRVAGAALLLAAMGCTSGPPAPPSPAPSPQETTSRTPSAVPTTPEPTTPEPTTPEPGQRPPVRPRDFDAAAAMAVVRHLAGTIGPRHATSPDYRRAARWTVRYLRRLGYDVRRQPVAVPGGISWTVPVAPGTSWNVVATPPGFEPARPHLVVGAHLDTVPESPGAEDNASGVGVLLAVAQVLAESEARHPVVLVAFGAEEPRGTTDADHHYGSRALVADLSDRQRASIRGMLSLDRVGVGSVVPVCTAREGTDPAQAEALEAGRRAGVPTSACESRASDHWSFVRAGLPGVRVGGTSYAGYHSPRDVVSVVDEAQLGRTGRLVLSWLAPLG